MNTSVTILFVTTRHRYIFLRKYNAQNLVWNWYGSMEDCLQFHSWNLPFHSILASYEELVVQNLCREPHSSVTIRHFCKQKRCCHVIATHPPGWHRCPNPNCNARFWSKNKIALCISFPVPAYCVTHSQPKGELNLGAKVGSWAR